MSQPVLIQSAPGIKRDGTRLEGESYIDGQWCRFQRGRPKKMGGYQAVSSAVPELIRGMSSFSSNGLQYLHLGGATTLSQFLVNNNGNLSGINDRTPAGLSGSVDNLWQLDVFYDAANVISNLIAHAAPNLSDIDSSVDREIWMGQVTDSAILTDTTLPSVSGGVCVLGPYLMSFGNNGRIGWSDANDPSTLDSEAFITQQKFVKGVPLRGAGSGPAGLFWSLDSLIRATFTGGTTVWRFDTLASDISILSSQGVIEYDGVFYWMGVDRILMFNGVIREVPNDKNLDWFFDNLNYAQRQKVFAYKVPRYGEIWWCYPRGSATECTHAIIYNVREGSWYDTQLPDTGRTSGIYAKVYRKPFMIDTVNAGAGFTLWQHETGTDKINQSSVQPIPSSFETAEISMLKGTEPQSQSLYVARIEPDFKQTGNMTMTVRGRINAKAPIVTANPVTFPDVAAQGDEETIKVQEVRRLMSFRFESNVSGGNYEMGECYAHVAPSDSREET